MTEKKNLNFIDWTSAAKSSDGVKKNKSLLKWCLIGVVAVVILKKI